MSELFGRSDARVGDLTKHDAQELRATLGPLLDSVRGVSWYERPGADVDLLMARLCLLRRAEAGAGADALAGDEAVRKVLEQADPEVVVWLLSRAVSFMDEQGFPDFVPGARLGE